MTPPQTFWDRLSICCLPLWFVIGAVLAEWVVEVVAALFNS